MPRRCWLLSKGTVRRNCDCRAGGQRGNTAHKRSARKASDHPITPGRATRPHGSVPCLQPFVSLNSFSSDWPVGPMEIRRMRRTQAPITSVHLGNDNVMWIERLLRSRNLTVSSWPIRVCRVTGSMRPTAVIAKLDGLFGERSFNVQNNRPARLSAQVRLIAELEHMRRQQGCNNLG